MKRLAVFVFAVIIACSSVAPPLPDPMGTRAFGSVAADSPPAPASTTGEWEKVVGPVVYAFENGRSMTLAVKKARRLRLSGPGEKTAWKSSNERVAAVSANGVVRARRPGITIITASDPAANRTAACTVKVFRKRTQRQVRLAILSLRKRYYPGRPWTNDDYYFWQADNCHCYGCVAFVGIASDRAFGKFAPLSRHDRFSRIRAGDHVRIGGDHSVIVLRKWKKAIVVAEGNYNDTFNWGREITFADLKREGFYVETRYPTKGRDG